MSNPSNSSNPLRERPDRAPAASVPSSQSGSASLTPIVVLAGAAALTGVGLAVIAWSRQHVIHDLPLTAALDGELHPFQSRAGLLAYYANGPVRRATPLAASPAPLLFIHSINAAASSYEMKPLYDHYARDRRVYALDLPGYGFSERSPRAYSPALMRLAITEFIEKELKGTPVDVVALSLSGEFLALAAQANPKLFRSLTFISPTGMGRNDVNKAGNDGALATLEVPLWRRPFYDLLTSRASIRYFLQRSQRQRVGNRAVHYAYLTSHQPNAEWAPLHFLSGKLWTPTIFDTYAELQQPSLLLYGRDPYASYERVDQLRTRSNWRIVPFENTGGLVHWDDPNGAIAQINKIIS